MSNNMKLFPKKMTFKRDQHSIFNSINYKLQKMRSGQTKSLNQPNYDKMSKDVVQGYQKKNYDIASTMEGYQNEKHQRTARKYSDKRCQCKNNQIKNYSEKISDYYGQDYHNQPRTIKVNSNYLLSPKNIQKNYHNSWKNEEKRCFNPQESRYYDQKSKKKVYSWNEDQERRFQSKGNKQDSYDEYLNNRLQSSPNNRIPSFDSDDEDDQQLLVIQRIRSSEVGHDIDDLQIVTKSISTFERKPYTMDLFN